MKQKFIREHIVLLSWPKRGLFLTSALFLVACQTLDSPQRDKTTSVKSVTTRTPIPPSAPKQGPKLKAPRDVIALETITAMDKCPRTNNSVQIRFVVQEDLKLVRKPNLIGLPFALSRKQAVHSLTGFTAQTRSGDHLPVQFEALSRWGGGPRNCNKPIRWAYAWVKADLLPSARGYLLIRHSPQEDLGFGPAISIKESKKTVVIDTGPSRFTLRKKGFNGLSLVEMKSPSGWVKVAKTPAGRSSGFLVRRKEISSSISSTRRTKFEIERHGPLLATIAVKSHYTKPNGKTLFRVTARLMFHAGESSVQIDHTYYNGDTVSDSPSGANNRVLSDRVFFQLPLSYQARNVHIRAHKQTHKYAAIKDTALTQHKRSPKVLEPAYSISRADEDLEAGYLAKQPYIAVSGDEYWSLATVAYLSARDPQGIRYNQAKNALEIDWQSEELFVGGARGIWSRALIDFGTKNRDIDLAGRQAYAHVTRPLIAVPSIKELNASGAWPLLASGTQKDAYHLIDETIDKMHEQTVYYLQKYKITGTQIWPDLPRSSCIFENDCAFSEGNYYDGGDNNYWDWSLAELEAFLRTADPAFIHDFSLAEAILMAETISFRPDPSKQAGLNFAGFSPCYGSARGYEGPYMEGLNQRRDRCPGDYSYNRVHKLAYLLTADRRFTDFFSQGARSVADYYALPLVSKPGQWRELSSSRFTNQMLEQLLNGAEFGLIGGDQRAERYLKHALGIFDYMQETSLIGGHACILAGSGFSDPALFKKCESDQAWMLPLLLDFTTRLYSLTQHAPIKTWLTKHTDVSLKHYMGVSDSGSPNFNRRDADWVTTYVCEVNKDGVLSKTCAPARDIENQGRFYNGDYTAYLNTFAHIFWALPELRSNLCAWLPYAYAQSLRLLDRDESNAMVWGKYPGKIFADAQKTLGAIEACE